MQMDLTPSYPAQYLQSVLNGIPLFRSVSGDDSEGYNNNGFFQRAQEQQHGPPPTSKPFLVKPHLPQGLWLLEHNVCPTCRYQLQTQTEVSTSQSEQPTTAGAIAGTETEQEPSMPDTTSTVTGVRRQRPTETFCPREVHQRVNEPAPVDDVVDLDFMLEQEADVL
ncbi:hypothetical protein PsorP6_007016 [Peronosclerospora sorghi]|uniref:Uncharacterized protein n=1 Tax=Peronosclerospora sorghi TaxID=230839 RepID=A0ACC0W9Q8_9STRA|nr:hypothetical protein PsorP6_007016 [Peronosclerospora sorghi]